MANYFNNLTGSYPVDHRNESEREKHVKKGVRGDKDGKLLEIWKKDRTWLKYEYMSIPPPPPIFKKRCHFFKN